MSRPKKRGFQRISAEARRNLGRLGGKVAHAKRSGVHEWTRETAGKAGRKGGIARAKKMGQKARKDWGDGHADTE